MFGEIKLYKAEIVALAKPFLKKFMALAWPQRSRPWPRGTSRPNFYGLGLASKVQALALALRAALTLFWHHPQTQGPTTTAKVKL